MTLPASGAITMAQINTELGFASTAEISLGSTIPRSLANTPAGPISMSDFYSKTARIVTTVTAGVGSGFTGYKRFSYGSISPDTTPQGAPGGTKIIEIHTTNEASGSCTLSVNLGYVTTYDLITRGVIHDISAGVLWSLPSVMQFTTSSTNSVWFWDDMLRMNSGQTYKVYFFG